MSKPKRFGLSENMKVFPDEFYQVCGRCFSGDGGECHVPGCAYWMDVAPSKPRLFVPGECEPELGRVVIWYCHECGGGDGSSWIGERVTERLIRDWAGEGHQIVWIYAPPMEVSDE